MPGMVKTNKNKTKKTHQETSEEGVEGLNGKVLGCVARDRREGEDHVGKWELLKGF